MNFPSKMEFEYNLILTALEEVSKIKRAQNVLRKSTKQNFNLFYGLVGNKVYLEKYHSNFIWYLLDSEESHDCDSLFLKQFVQLIKIEIANRKGFSGLFSEENPLKKETFEIENASVRGEHIIPGRRIDITIQSSSKTWIIFIENKFKSGEGNSQVSDYYKWCKDNYDQVLGIFLTLKGEDARSIKDSNEKEEILNLSYGFIITWLENCCVDKEIIKYPHITNSIFQYVTILKKELNVLEDMEKEELKKWLKENTNTSVDILMSAEELIRVNEEVVLEKRKLFHEDLMENLRKLLNEQVHVGIIFQKRVNDKIILKVRDFEFIIRLEQSYPKADPEESGKGLWWGVYKTDSTPVVCELEYNNWEPLIINDVNDFYNDKLGYEQIIKIYKDKKGPIETVKLIVDKIIEKVLPTLAKITQEVH